MNETTKFAVDWSAAWAAVRILRRSCELRPGDAEAVDLIADYLRGGKREPLAPPSPAPAAAPEQPEPAAPRRRSPHGKRIQRKPAAPAAEPAAPAPGPGDLPADPPPAEPAAPHPAEPVVDLATPDRSEMQQIATGSNSVAAVIEKLKQHGFSQARIARACDLDEAGISSAARGKVFPYIDKRFRQLFRIPPAAPSSGNAAVERHREIHGGA